MDRNAYLKQRHEIEERLNNVRRDLALDLEARQEKWGWLWPWVGLVSKRNWLVTGASLLHRLFMHLK